MEELDPISSVNEVLEVCFALCGSWKEPLPLLILLDILSGTKSDLRDWEPIPVGQKKQRSRVVASIS